MEKPVCPPKLHKKIYRTLVAFLKTGHPDIYSIDPTIYLCVTNSSPNCGVTAELLKELFGNLEGFIGFKQYETRSYSILTFDSPEHAKSALEKFYGYSVPSCSSIFYIFYLKYYPQFDKSQQLNFPSGLELIPEFLSNEEELELLQYFETHKEYFAELKNRRVLHFEHSFDYGSNSAFVKTNPMPSCVEMLAERLKPYFGDSLPDQITVNHYAPGQCIPMHVDTHSAFEETIASVSLKSPINITYVHCANAADKIEVPLKSRSLMLMKGESRYCYRHGIRPRTTDVDPVSEEITPRGERYSITFRRIRRKPCECPYLVYCDWDRNGANAVPKDNRTAARIESEFVQASYDAIADHFSQTRHSKWNAVAGFLASLPSHSVVIDAGCGNGKYLLGNKRHSMFGFDICEKLVRIASDHGQVSQASIFNIPFRAGVADAVISIAVIHHMSTDERRLAVLREIVRVLAVGGLALVTVWSFEQRKDGVQSVYDKNRNNHADENGSDVAVDAEEVTTADNKPTESASLPIHDGQQFTHADMLVPWKLPEKNGMKFRYYHLFQEGELDGLLNSIPGVSVVSSSFEEGNYVVIFQKISNS